MTQPALLRDQGTHSDWEQLDLYRVFAYAFGAPTRDRFEWLSAPQTVEVLARMQNQKKGAKRASVRPFQRYEDYESSYIALFDVGVPEPPVPLVESAHRKDVPAQQIALENVEFYQVLGMRHNPASYAPDHLVTQLEFLGLVRYAWEKANDCSGRESLERLERDFLNRHLLNWLPSVERKLARIQPPLFPTLMSLLLADLRAKTASLGGR